MKSFFRSISLLLSLSVGAAAEPVGLVVSSATPLGKLGARELGNYLEVSHNSSTGIYRIELGVDGRGVVDGEEAYTLGIGDSRPALWGTWPEGVGWTQFSMLEYTSDFDTGFITDGFDPYGLGNWFPHSPAVLVLPPLDSRQSGPHNISIGGPMCGGPCTGTLELAFRVESIEAPLDGDFNLDDSVDLADFQVLRDSYRGRRTFAWFQGDINLDARVDFEDFLLFSHNYGASRSVASSVPEPTPQVGFIALLPMLLRRRGR